MTGPTGSGLGNMPATVELAEKLSNEMSRLRTKNHRGLGEIKIKVLSHGDGDTVVVHRQDLVHYFDVLQSINLWTAERDTLKLVSLLLHESG